MANIHERTPLNVPGKFYVDESCIDCDMCRSNAPGVFQRNEDNGRSYVHHQPTTPEEVALAEDALAACPTESIGNDGEG